VKKPNIETKNMKKITYILLITVLGFSCSKDNEILVSDKSSDGDYLGLMSEASGGSGSSSNGGDNGDEIQIEPGQITAGEWKDLENWDFWNNLDNEEAFENMDAYWEYDLSERISVKVKNLTGDMLQNEKIEIIDTENNVIWQAITDNAGMTELWPGLSKNYQNNESLRIRLDGKISNSVLRYEDGINELVLDKQVESNITKNIDIAFMVDATGSMGDELEYLKVELIDVIHKVEQNNQGVNVNLGAVFYRDEGDEYVTRKSDFKSDYSVITNFIAKQRADGGGDFPEAVHSGLRISINDLQWSSSSYSRILFMVLDAPPHYDAQIIDEIQLQVKKAAAAGIKLIPITASGIDKETEFLMRYIAMATNGSYVFVTNHSGIGGDHIEPSIGQYEVEYLNELMVRVIGENLE